MSTITIEDYKQQLNRHDWTYMFSDDHRVYTAGEKDRSRLIALAEQSGDDFKRAFNEAYAAVFHRDPFAKPYRFPFTSLEAQP